MRTRRVIGATAIAALAATLIACSTSDSTNGSAPDATDTADNRVVAEAMVYGGRTYCVYPDDLDDMSEEAVAAYCADVVDTTTGQPVAPEYWIEAEEPGKFDETDTSLATLAWIYYLKYVQYWFMSDLFILAYIPVDLHDDYRAKHKALVAKYQQQVAAYSPKGVYKTPSGKVVPPNQLGQYKVAPRSCRLISMGEQASEQIVPANHAATRRPNTGSNPQQATRGPGPKPATQAPAPASALPRPSGVVPSAPTAGGTPAPGVSSTPNRAPTSQAPARSC